MEKRRVFKRSKPTEEKKPEKKAAPIKKPAEKKHVPVKVERPAEKSQSVKEVVVPKHLESDHVSHAENLEQQEQAKAADRSEGTTATESVDAHEYQSTIHDDIVVVEETTVTEVINDTDRSRRNLSFIWIFLGIFIIFLAGGIIFLFLFQQPQKPEQVYTAPTDTPAPTKPVMPAKETWKVEILNGSGVPGAAAKMAKQLESLGYTVVKTGNADETQTSTEYYLAKDFMQFSDSFAADLQKEQISAKIGGELQNSSNSARIIIGTE